jgi:hypothetical protein
MKRFGLWLTMVSMFSLAGLVFAQATGGSTCSAAKEGGAGKTTGGKKKISRESKVVGKKGASKTKTSPNPKLETCTGKKPGADKNKQ